MVKYHEKALVIFLLFIAVSAANSAAEEVSLNDFMAENNFTFRWTPLADIGELRYGQESFRFRPGEDFFIHNFMEKIPGRITRKNGIINIDGKTAEKILEMAGFAIKTAAVKGSEVKEGAKKPSGHRIAAILIDPGHGGRDSGAVGRHDVEGQKLTVNEKDIVLDIALELNKMLVSTYRDKKIILTRNSDTYPSLEERVEKANNVKLEKNEAIVFISIHANASFNKNAKGFEVWYLPPDYRRELIDEKSIDKNSREILPILNTMLEEEFTIESILLAQNILDGIDSAVGVKELNRGLKEETWFVVRNAKMPSVLIEVGFVSNTAEAVKLSDRGYLKKVTEGIYNGIKRFIDNLETISIGGEM